MSNKIKIGEWEEKNKVNPIKDKGIGVQVTEKGHTIRIEVVSLLDKNTTKKNKDRKDKMKFFVKITRWF